MGHGHVTFQGSVDTQQYLRGKWLYLQSVFKDMGISALNRKLFHRRETARRAVRWNLVNCCTAEYEK